MSSSLAVAAVDSVTAHRVVLVLVVTDHPFKAKTAVVERQPKAYGRQVCRRRTASSSVPAEQEARRVR